MFYSQEKIEMATRVTSEAVGSSIVFFRKKYITPAFGNFFYNSKFESKKSFFKIFEKYVAFFKQI